MMLDSSVDNEAEAERIVRMAERKFAGNPGQVMFVIRDGGDDDNSRFIPITAQNEGDWQALHEQAVGDIVVAHSWFRTLSGLDYSSGFSAERILHEYEVALNTVILAEQAELTEPIRRVISELLGLRHLVAGDRQPPADPFETHLHEGLGGPQGRRPRLRSRGPAAAGLPLGDLEIQHHKHRMIAARAPFAGPPVPIGGSTSHGGASPKKPLFHEYAHLTPFRSCARLPERASTSRPTRSARPTSPPPNNATSFR